MDTDKLYGDAALATQLCEPRRSEQGGYVTLPVRVQGLTPPLEDGSYEVRAIALSPAEARELALKLLTEAGPERDRHVRNYRAGDLLMTVDAPPHALDAKPWLFVRPRDDGEFEDALEMLGGPLAFAEPSPEATALHLDLASLEGEGARLGVHLELAPGMRPKAPVVSPAMERLIERRRAQVAQTEEEEVAGARLTVDLIAAKTTTGRLLRRLQELARPVTVEELASAALVSAEAARSGVRELVNAKLVTEGDEDPPMLTPNIEAVRMRREEEGVVFEAIKSHGPITQAELAEMLPDHAADLGNTLTNLTVANVIRLESAEGDADARFERNPGWSPCFEGEEGSALGFHEEGS